MSQHSRFAILYLSVIVLLVGHGLQLTLLPLRAQAIGWSITDIGLSGSFYFLGFLVGCMLVPKFVASVGYIRTFSTTTSLCGAALLAILLSDEVWLWCGARLLSGIGISGCYLIIESWLNEQSTNEQRGSVLALYTMIVLFAMSGGQLLTNAAPVVGLALPVIGSLLLSLSVLPVSLVRVQEPEKPAAISLDFRAVWQHSPAALGGTLAAGLVTGVLFTLTPVFGQRMALPAEQIPMLMVVMVLGGAVFQYPIGKLSDRVDRRHVILGLAAIGIALTVVGWLVSGGDSWFYLGMMFLIGGIANAIYPLCLAHANDRYPGHFLQVGMLILVANSIGAVIGPWLGGWVMQQMEGGFFVVLGTGLILALMWVGFWILKHPTSPIRQAYVPLLKSTQGALELDTRSTETTNHELDERG